MKIAYFGGSFNPPHAGHLGAAEGALRSGRTEQVWFAPAWRPPHKLGRAIAPFADRLAMVQLLTEGHPGLEASDIEEKLKLEPSYTIDVLNALEVRTGIRFQLLIGGDSLRWFHTWHRAEELAERFEILTYPRSGETPDAAELRRNWRPDLAEKLAAGILSGKFFEISSTEIRNSMANDEETSHINKEDIPDRIRDYLEKRNLYRSN